MTNSLKKKTQGEVMNIPPGIDRRIAVDGTVTYRVRIRIKEHRPVSKTFKNLTHAKQWKRTTESQIEQGLYLSFSKAEQHTLAKAIVRYEKEVLPHKPKDFPNVKRHLERWKQELGHLKLSRINPSLIAEKRDLLLSETIHGGKLRSNATVSRYMASLSHVLTTAVKEWQWLNENPCLKVKKPKEPPGRVRYLSKDELVRLLSACQQSKNKNLYLIILLALTTGSRKSEVLGLKWQDVDFDNNLLHLRDTKNGEDRSIPMSQLVLELLKHLEVKSGNVCLFPSMANPTQPCCIRSAWKSALKRAKIENFKLHDTRHTTASYLAIEGRSLREIAEVLGHKTLQTTARYAHLSQAAKKGLVQQVESIIEGALHDTIK